MTTEEQRIKKQLKAVIEKHKGYWAIVQGGPYSKPGDPDIIACLDGMFIGIEAKTPTGRLSEIQKIRGQQIEDAGGVYLVVRSAQELDDELRRRGFPKDA